MNNPKKIDEIRLKDDNSSLIRYCKYLRAKYNPVQKILFIQTPQFVLKSFNFEVAKKRGYYAFPPTGLQHLYEVLKNRDMDIRILDLNFMILKKVIEDETFNYNQWMTMLKENIVSFKPYIIGVSCMFDSSIQPLIRILEYLKKNNSAIVIAGGVIATYEWKKILSREMCHFVIEGEGEHKINYLFDFLLEENNNIRSTSGIFYKYENELFESKGAPATVDMKGDLVDSYSQVPIEEYNKYGSLNPFSRIANLEKSRFAAIQMSRGCRAACNFCSVRNFMGKGVRKRSINDVFREMEFLVNQRGIRHFEWLDDDLLFYKKEFHSLLEIIIKKGWNITWSANNGLIAKSIDDKTLQLMRDSGCSGFKVGIETGNEGMLKTIRKPAKLYDFRKLSCLLYDYPEIFVGGNFIIGFPGETFSQMMDSFRFYLELNLDWGAFTVCQAIRGANAFSDFQDYFDRQINANGDISKNFIPARESSSGNIVVNENVLEGLTVFKIPPDSKPGEDQIKEIWFTFNLVGNFINNKNLKPGGKVSKFISWVEMAQVAYPVNPYMILFLSLAYLIDGNAVKSKEYYNKTLLHSKSYYWVERFNSFGLTEVINNFPENKNEAFKAMENLCKSISIYY